MARKRLTSWNDKRVVITGASSGIGRLLALRGASEGARVALVARREDRLREVAEMANAAGGETMIVPCDVGDGDAVQQCAATILDRWGGVDVLVNNAGYGGHFRFLEWDVTDIERMVRVNFLGTVYWTKALLSGMVDRRSGWIVMMASVAGKIGVPRESVYSATKFAMVGLSEALSIEVEDSGVHVLTVCPGAIDTEFFSELDRERMPEVALRSMIQPERVVDAVFNGLAKGKREITVPAMIACAYGVKAVAPAVLRSGVRRSTRARRD
ncbi:MAG: SDR family oxidoreductase [Candidatus Hydrogenedentes bacterium]|nr:SDR family oxidoreductase [Candidatus Hydrogenedentota bacterium]